MALIRAGMVAKPFTMSRLAAACLPFLRAARPARLAR